MVTIIRYFCKNPTTSMALIAVLVCAFRFLFDGCEMYLFGHLISIPHTDDMSYAAFLGPILGAHGYVRGKHGGKQLFATRTKAKLSGGVDNPDL